MVIINCQIKKKILPIYCRSLYKMVVDKIVTELFEKKNSIKIN